MNSRIYILCEIFWVLTLFFPGRVANAAEQQLSSSTQRTANFRINPIGIIFGIPGFDLDLALGKDFTLGPSLAYLSANAGTTEMNAPQVGIRGNIYLSGKGVFTQGAVLGPAVYYLPITAQQVNGKASSTVGHLLVGSTINYQWIWNSGINVDVGIGAVAIAVVYASGFSQHVKTPTFAGIEPLLEFSAGWAF